VSDLFCITFWILYSTSGNILLDMDSFTLLTTNIFSPSMILFLAIFLFLILGFFILVAVIIRLSAQMKYITYPVYDQVIKEAQSKATKIIGDATEQSQSIRTSVTRKMQKRYFLIEKRKMRSFVRNTSNILKSYCSWHGHVKKTSLMSFYNFLKKW